MKRWHWTNIATFALLSGYTVFVLCDWIAVKVRAQTPVSTQQSIALMQHRDIFSVPNDTSINAPQSFTLEQAAADGTEAVYLNGLLMAPGIDYAIMGASLQFLPVQPVGTGAIVQVRYWAAK